MVHWQPEMERYLLALALFVLSMIVQQPLLFLAALFSLVIGIVPGWWYHQALRHLLVRQHVTPQHLFCGEEVVLTWSIENQKLLPVPPWLHVAGNVTPLLPVLTKDGSQRENVGQLANAWVLWPLQRVTRRYRMCCSARGCYTFGPVTLHTSDPFGWLEREVTVPLYCCWLLDTGNASTLWTEIDAGILYCRGTTVILVSAATTLTQATVERLLDMHAYARNRAPVGTDGRPGG